MEKVQILLSVANAAVPSGFDDAVKKYIADLNTHRFTEGVPAPTAPHHLVERAVMRVQKPVPATYTHVHKRTVHELGEDEHGNPVVVPREITEVGETVHFTSSNEPDDFVPNYELVDDGPGSLSTAQKKDKLEGEVSAMTQSWVAVNTIPHRRLALLRHRVHETALTQENLRTSHQMAAVATCEQHDIRMLKITKWHAEQLDAIEDLTDATVDAWQPAPLPTV